VDAPLVSALAPPRAVVTGGAGFIGSTLVDRLVDEGIEVLVVDDLSTGQLDNLTGARARGEVQFHQLDVRDELLSAVVTRFAPAVVFHLAARGDPDRGDPVTDAEVNVVGTVNVIETVRATGVHRLVYVTSATQLYDPGARLPVGPRTPHKPTTHGGAAAHAALGYLEYGARVHDLEYAALGIATAFGPRQGPDGRDGVVVRTAQALLAGRRPLLAGQASHTRDLVYVEDVVDAIFRAAGRGTGRYLNVATGVETTLGELARLVAKIVGSTRRPEFEDKGDEPARMAFDPAPARNHLGWEPWTPLDVGLEDTVASLRG